MLSGGLDTHDWLACFSIRSLLLKLTAHDGGWDMIELTMSSTSMAGRKGDAKLRGLRR